jgi:glycosyltransferase involved in cell wall biosynthesis
MKVAIVAPSPVPFVLGGAENLWSGLLAALNETPGVEADLVKLPSPERNFREIVDSYRRFAALELDHFDLVITTKYPAWMIAHRNHVVLLQHKLRGLYDTWPSPLSTDLDESWPLPARLRALLEARPTTRAVLPGLFAAIDDLQARAATAPAEMFALPGALIRAIVHLLDGIGLAPQAVRRYLAISHTVAARADYFPPHVPVEVLHHPTQLRTRRGDAQCSIFTASRLVPAKRVALLIEAYRRADVELPLRIAGEGGDLPRLRALAGDDARIQFLGRITDDALAEEYANALVVAFVPDREDYGLITLEAMQSGKPVLTVSDAGGVTELVRDGENGRIVAPTAEALAEATRGFCADPAAAARMGEAAAESVRDITWKRTVDRLLSSSAPDVAVRPRVVIANTFGVHPPASGGQERIFHLYRHLTGTHDVDVVALDSFAKQPQVRELQPGFREWLVPKTEEFHVLRAEVAADALASVEDVVAAAYHEVVPAFGERLRERMRDAAAVVAAHPYTYPAISDAWEGALVYDAHNVEALLKAAIFRPGSRWAGYVRDVERACARRADLLLACSDEDAAALRTLYAVEPARVQIIVNGCDLESLQWVDPERRRALQERLGLAGSACCLFIGSGHAPNVSAARQVVKLARGVPGARFVLVGSVCSALRSEPLPANVVLAGRVSDAEKAVWMNAADIGLNPMGSGSGTNLKVVAYAAVGMAVLSTPLGLRGGVLEPHTHAWVAEIDEMRDVLVGMIASPEERDARAVRARERVEAVADWRVLAERLRQRLAVLERMRDAGATSLLAA